jgi:hypothetical protein
MDRLSHPLTTLPFAPNHTSAEASISPILSISPTPSAFGGTYGYAPFSCGYTDLDITCSWDGRKETPTIQLNGSDYTVLNIIYDNLTIVLADTDVLLGCSCPRVRHNITFAQADEWLQYNGVNFSF